MLKNLYFLGGITAAIIVAVLGVSLAQAANTSAPVSTEITKNSTCGCGQAKNCGNAGCAAKAGKGACNCGQKGANFIDTNNNGICDRME